MPQVGKGRLEVKWLRQVSEVFGYSVGITRTSAASDTCGNSYSEQGGYLLDDVLQDLG